MVTSSQSKRITELIRDSRAYYCLECGKCTARCPIARADKSFSPVLNIAKTIRGYDHEIWSDKAIWACTICEACSTACPSDVDYPRLVLGMRAEALKSGKEGSHRLELEHLFLSEGPKEGFGVFRQVSSVQTSISGSEGGVVTSLLVKGMNRNFFDSAIVVRRGNNQKNEAFITEDPGDITSAKGSKYELLPILEKFVEAVQERGKKRIAVVGLPCQIFGLREIQRSMPDVDLTAIGLFCMENFRYNLLKKRIEDLLHVDLDNAESAVISKGNFIVSDRGKTISCKVKDLMAAVRTGCLFCTDFTSELADISIGSVGSPDGYTTVIARTQKGEELLNLLKDRDRASADYNEIARMVSQKNKHGFDQLRKDFSFFWDDDEG
jgi:coenzyme F420 hydrogenase subunit beta